MKKISLIVFHLILVVSVLSAQKEETLFGKTGLKITGAWGGPAFGTTFFENETAVTRGTFWMLEFNDVISAGFGNERTFESVQLIEGEVGKYDFKHNGFHVSFYPQTEKVLHPTFGFMLGGGELNDNQGTKDGLFVVQPTAGLEVNVFKWWKVGVDGGYRIVTRVSLPGVENEDLSAFFINLKLRFGFSW